MGHQTFLHETLWCFAQSSCLTDLTLQCEDKKVTAHRAILSTCCKALSSTFPALSSAEQAVLLLPGWDAWQVEQALHKVYISRDPSELETILGLRDQSQSLSSVNWQDASLESIENLDNFFPDHEEEESLKDTNYSQEDLTLKKVIVKCSLCLKIFEDKLGLELHEKKEHFSKHTRKACDVCGFEVAKLKEHMLRKHPEILDKKQVTNFECNLCNYKTRIKSTLKQHIFNIHSERNLSCDSCSFKTARISQLNQHKKKVHGVANIQCTFDGCARKFVQECDLRDHIKRTHPTGFFNCHHCGKQFVNEEKMKRHIKMHNIDTEGLPCSMCSCRFITKQKLKEHMNTHTGETPYKCPGIGCEKAFMSSSALSHHKKACSYLQDLSKT